MDELFIYLLNGWASHKETLREHRHTCSDYICMVFEIVINPNPFHFCIHYPLTNAGGLCISIFNAFLSRLT